VNNYIKALWEESTFTVWPRDGDYSSVSASAIEKFAKCVIDDCVAQCERAKDDAEYSFTPARARVFRIGADAVSKRIKIFFGIS